LLKYCLRATVKASKKRLNFCEVSSGIYVWDWIFADGPNCPFPEKNHANPNGCRTALSFGMNVEVFLILGR
jgi:hypothetical protein